MKILIHVWQGVEDYSMLRDGDWVLVCLSGGKDSLSLLHTIRQYQFYCKAKVSDEPHSVLQVITLYYCIK